jgi:hypothetical protein
MKKTAAISAIFILSIHCQVLPGNYKKELISVLTCTHMLRWLSWEGLCGAYFGSLKLNQNFLKYLLAIVLIIASYKLLIYISLIKLYEIDSVHVFDGYCFFFIGAERKYSHY